MTFPRRLYRYRQFNALSIQDLERRQLFFASANKLNDPFDCAVEHIVRRMDNAEYKKFLADFERDRPGELQRISLGKTPQQVREFIENYAYESTKQAIVELFSNRGVCCFSDKVDHLLMWSHYSDGHKGFCLEFDTASSLFTKRPKRVLYQSKHPTISFSDTQNAKNSSLMERALFTKFRDWGYESEWRAIHQAPDQLYSYPPEALTGIYFGLNMVPEHKKTISSIINGSTTTLYDMTRIPGRFALSAVEYVP